MISWFSEFTRPNRSTSRWSRPVGALAVVLLMTAVIEPVAAARVRIGITLHPYHAWVANIVEERADIVALIAADEDPHGYQIKAEDIAKMADLDVLVLNGLGHDEFAVDMLRAIGSFTDS